MKNRRIVVQDFNKTVRNALLKGEIISGIAAKRSGDLMAKYTKTMVNNILYYGIWEKDLLEGKWHLLHFGEKKEVEPEWNGYKEFWTQYGENVTPMVA
ncbi:MAG TPA: hypothetical protein DDW27_15235 [Bacteroidales bacterium]|nr:hypothetical protein [Bacteroidales bacterium]